MISTKFEHAHSLCKGLDVYHAYTQDMEVQYPKIRLEEEGIEVHVAGTHPKGTKYTGKYGAHTVPHFLLVA